MENKARKKGREKGGLDVRTEHATVRESGQHRGNMPCPLRHSVIFINNIVSDAYCSCSNNALQVINSSENKNRFGQLSKLTWIGLN